MKTNFFSDIQGKFSAEFHGRYLGNILEHISSKRIEVIEPLLRVAPLRNRKLKMNAVRDVTTEDAYLPEYSRLQDMKDGKDRRADLAIELDNGECVGKVLIEIKVKDKLLPGRLADYVSWAKGRTENDDRAVVFLTASPLDPVEHALIADNSEYVRHIYLSEFTDRLRTQINESELIDLFVNYLCQEGYAMFQLKPASENNEIDADYEALLSFLVLTFLPHNSGKGKVSTSRKIIRGPVVFGNLVQNWQQVSDRLADLKLGAGRRPTIRYFPEQGVVDSTGDIKNIPDENILYLRKKIRMNKRWGRFWLTSDSVLEDGVRIEWGQIIEIHKGTQENDINCYLYALIKKNGVQLSGELICIDGGFRNQELYSVERFIDRLNEVLQKAVGKALEKTPALKVSLRFN